MYFNRYNGVKKNLNGKTKSRKKKKKRFKKNNNDFIGLNIIHSCSQYIFQNTLIIIIN